ncbi:ABC transporter ATP-binding protein [Acidisoma cellulosilytica]|uniref:ABC transporter ATP-binding protein n=1 Tax=Acidisoma cellulosilyticum TaxID=2802395 RepID=A0A963Z868_9PROT|nr:ABC transporter ATP-binding protein [Acidisoma cellulosilyticum]MCB8883647.1 ABC transporter ATP-binding protein [Acidisoma cellulosilyticum]
MADLHITGLRKAFDNTPILRELTLSVARGNLVAVLGASGSGKTTLLRLICGFERADAGTISIDGAPVCGPGLHLRPEQRHIGYVAQEGALFPHLSVAANITFGLPWRQRRVRSRVAELLALVGLPEAYADRAPYQLSGGEQQRVALARALAPSPALVLLDEPFSALDEALRLETRQAVTRALTKAGATTLLVTHDQSEALSMANAVAALRAGELVQVADPRTLYQQPADAELAKFLGKAVMVPGQAMGDCAITPFGKLPLAGSPETGPVQILIRPEQICLVPSGEGYQVSVRTVTFHGSFCRVTLQATENSIPIEALVPGHSAPILGTIVAVRVEGTVMAYSHLF